MYEIFIYKLIFEHLLKIEIKNCGMLLNKNYLVFITWEASHRNRPNYCMQFVIKKQMSGSCGGQWSILYFEMLFPCRPF